MLSGLSLRQLDSALARWRSLPAMRPHAGWLKAIRQTLGRTTRQLANAVGVTQAAVVDAERAEARGDISLTTLRRYAAAMECELVYALVPKRPLKKIIEERAERVAREQVARVRHSMALEDQATARAHADQEVDALRRQLLEGRRSRLWR